MIQHRDSPPASPRRVQRNGFDSPALPPPRLNSDIYETVDGDAYILEIPVPGLDAQNIEIEATSEQLTVRTQQRNTERDERRYVVRELPMEPLSRVFEFPVEVNPDEVSANLEGGMLKIRVPKAAASRRRVIKLQAS